MQRLGVRQIIIAVLCLVNINAVSFVMPTASYAQQNEYEVYYEYIQDFNDISENTEFKKRRIIW